MVLGAVVVVVFSFGFVVGGDVVGGAVVGGEVVVDAPLIVNVACATDCAPAPMSHHACTSTGPGGASPGITIVVER